MLGPTSSLIHLRFLGLLLGCLVLFLPPLCFFLVQDLL